MKLYRGQAYGAPVGEWWTIEADEAVQYARARHARSWVVLCVDVEPDDVSAFALDPPLPSVYRVPVDALAALTLGVRVHDGCVYLVPEVPRA